MKAIAMRISSHHFSNSSAR